MVCGRGRGSGFFVKRGQATSLYHIGVSLQVKSQDFFERKRNKKFGKKTGLHNPVRFYLTKACASGLQFMACKKDRESCRAGQQADVGIGTKGTGPRAGYEEERKIEAD